MLNYLINFRQEKEEFHEVGRIWIEVLCSFNTRSWNSIYNKNGAFIAFFEETEKYSIMTANSLSIRLLNVVEHRHFYLNTEIEFIQS